LTERTIDPRILRAEIRKLRRHIDTLEAAIGIAEDEVARIKRVTGAGRISARILGILLKRSGTVSKAMLLDVVYYDRTEPSQKCTEVLISQTRARLKPLGISIQTVFGFGYAMDAADKAKLTELMQQQFVERSAA
jgi:DNA-binding response OmpR family regulator